MSNAIEMAPIINANVAAVAAALAAAGALSVTVSYSGSGDNSDGTGSIEIEWPEGANPQKLKVSGSKLDWIRDADGKFNKTPVVVERPLEWFLSDVLTDQIIEASGQDGFENGEGGCGEITVFADGRCTHEHWDYVVTKEYAGEFHYGVAPEEAMAVAGVRHKGSLIAKVPDHLKTEAVCTAAVEQDGWALSYVPEHMRTEALCLIAVQHAGANLRHVPVALRSHAICLTAMRAGAADAIAAVPVERRTESIWLELMRQTNYAPHGIVGLTSTEIQSIKRDLMQWNGLLLGELKEDARTLKLCQAAVAQNPKALKFVPEKWRAQLGPQSAPPAAISEDLKSLAAPLQTGPWASVI